MENDPWENLKAQFTAASTQDNMLGRPDYYQDVFAIQNSLDAALAQKQIEQEAQRILEDPVLLDEFLKQTGGGDSPVVPSGENKGSRSPLSIGIGAQTDQIKQDALKAAVRGLLTGGIPGAMMGGVKSYLWDTAKTLFDVNTDPDPIRKLNELQRWTKAPVESRTGQTPAEIAQANWARDVNEQAKSRMARQEGVGGDSVGNAPGASLGEVGDAAFSGEVGYDQ